MRDIVENGDAILKYTQGLDLETYKENSLIRDASERCLARVSEAAVKLGSLAEDLFPKHNWRGVRDFGNILRHDYEGVLEDAVWATATIRLPPLLVELKTFLAQYPEEQENL